MRTRQTRERDSASEAGYLDLAGEAMLAGMTREQVIEQLVSRIRRDENYLAYRKACNRRTSYDDQVLADMQAIALVAILLENDEGHHAHHLTPRAMLPAPVGRRRDDASRR